MGQANSFTRILRSRTEIESLRQFWNSCRPGRDADLDFYLFIVDLYPDVLRPHVVVLYENDNPRALLAGRLETLGVSIRAGYIKIPSPKLKVLNIVHGGWLGDMSHSSADLLVGSIIESLKTAEADAACLHYADLSLPLAQYARTKPRWLCS